MSAAQIPLLGWTQRWSERQHTWRHVSAGGFDRHRYDVVALDEAQARRFVERHHYAHSYPAARLRYGLWDGAALVGVAVLSVPVQKTVLTSVFPDLEPYQESLELGRFVLLDAVPANGESWFLARVWELAAREAGVRGVVSFSDPVRRQTLEGRVVLPGHIGVIYQASNARYLGRATARTLQLLPDGTVLSARALQKVRQSERGHASVERQLEAWGARPREAGEPGAAWLARARTAIACVWRSLRCAWWPCQPARSARPTAGSAAAQPRWLAQAARCAARSVGTTWPRRARWPTARSTARHDRCACCSQLMGQAHHHPAGVCQPREMRLAGVAAR